jgi:hypothetical protein
MPGERLNGKAGFFSNLADNCGLRIFTRFKFPTGSIPAITAELATRLELQQHLTIPPYITGSGQDPGMADIGPVWRFAGVNVPEQVRYRAHGVNIAVAVTLPDGREAGGPAEARSPALWI